MLRCAGSKGAHARSRLQSPLGRVAPEPALEDEQCPQSSGIATPAAAKGAEELADHTGAKDSTHREALEMLAQWRRQRSAEPFRQGHHEPVLRTVDDALGKVAPRDALQDVLTDVIAQLLSRLESHGKLVEPMIEVRHAGLERVRHGRPI